MVSLDIPPPSSGSHPMNILDEERRLPNGQKVDFGNGSSKKSKKPTSKKPNKDKSKAMLTSEDKELEVKSSSPSTDSLNSAKDLNQSESKGKKKKNNSSNKNKEKEKEKEKGSKSKKKTNEYPAPSLPNGAKPSFNNESSKSKKKGFSEQSLPNGAKPIFNIDDESDLTKNSKKQNKSNKDKKGNTEETYAGSSFHSSPAALNLPKPTFKSSPPQSSTSLQQAGSKELRTPIIQQPTMQQPSMQQPMHHIQNPVTAYSPLAPGALHPNEQLPGPMMYKPYVQPGFSYQVSPQGYISYPYLQHGPPGPGPVPANYNLVTSHYQPSWNFQNPPPTKSINEAQNSGHKISFNELLGSSKN